MRSTKGLPYCTQQCQKSSFGLDGKDWTCGGQMDDGNAVSNCRPRISGSQEKQARLCDVAQQL